MIVDLKAREALLRRQEQKKLKEDLTGVVKSGSSEGLLEPIKETGMAANNQVALTVMMLQTLQEVQELLANLAEKKQLGNEDKAEVKELILSLREIKKAFQAKVGTQKVEVTNPTPVVNPDFTPLVNAVYDLKKDLSGKPTKKEVLVDNMPLLNSLEMIAKKLDLLYKKDEGDKVRSVEITNFPPRMVPQPVTNISINSLRGVVNARAITISTSPTPIPPDPLANRRTWMIYNHSSQNVFLGGSDVLPASGLPVVPNTYSPAIDAGALMNIYGIVTSGTADVRLFEISDENVGK